MGRKPQALGLSKHSADSISLSMKFIVIQTMCRGQVRGNVIKGHVHCTQRPRQN